MVNRIDGRTRAACLAFRFGLALDSRVVSQQVCQRTGVAANPQQETRLSTSRRVQEEPREITDPPIHLFSFTVPKRMDRDGVSLVFIPLHCATLSRGSLSETSKITDKVTIIIVLIKQNRD